jgi:hypothetical protein
MDDMSGFPKALQRLKTWNTSEEHNNGKRCLYGGQRTRDFCSAIIRYAVINWWRENQESIFLDQVDGIMRVATLCHSLMLTLDKSACEFQEKI